MGKAMQLLGVSKEAPRREPPKRRSEQPASAPQTYRYRAPPRREPSRNPRRYPSELTDEQWARIEPLLIGPDPTGRPTVVWLDGGYQQGFVQWLADTTGWDVEVVRRCDPGRWGPKDPPAQEVASGFQGLPLRWIVERTFGWLGRYRRLSQDYEETISSSEAWLWLAGSRLLLARLADGAPL